MEQRNSFREKYRLEDLSKSMELERVINKRPSEPLA
jgi:hypothetical protein